MVFFTVITLAKVSDRISFQASQNYSESFRYLHPNQCESTPEPILKTF